MRSFITLGVLSLVGAVAFVGCGDDASDDGGNAGSAGAAGRGGSAGAAGSGGRGGTGGAAGNPNGGAAGAGGGAPTVPAANCTGCVQLTVGVNATPPVGATNNQAGYIFSAPATEAPFDLSDVSTITWRVQALTTNAAYFVQPVLQTAPPEDPNYSFGVYPAQVALTPAAFAPGAWVDVVLDVAALPGGGGADAGADAGADGDAGVVLTAFDKSKTRTISLNVGALPAGPLGFVSVQVDSVTVVGTSNFTSKTFTANAEGLSLNMFQVPVGTLAPAFR